MVVPCFCGNRDPVDDLYRLHKIAAVKTRTIALPFLVQPGKCCRAWSISDAESTVLIRFASILLPASVFRAEWSRSSRHQFAHARMRLPLRFT